ncbi:DUF2642 domain-containing protein [Paenibacillus chartarius]|uniref:DUF2642 domain-containing protein n=1 Tax=Paenibacillus chartarius TaxID=747481 RepID=A0ABV6DRP3_9BACL
MNIVRSFLNSTVELELSGRPLQIRGKLVDVAGDIIVLYAANQFIYVPSLHIQHLKPSDPVDADEASGAMPPPPLDSTTESISYRKMLMNAKGMFVELYITGNQSIHGYLTSIMNDYFVFYSPTFHHVFISMRHVKYVIPYTSQATPYLLPKDHFPVKPSSLTLARTFEQQLKKLENQFVILDLGDNPYKIGLLRKVEDGALELITANGASVILHSEHVKTLHLP